MFNDNYIIKKKRNTTSDFYKLHVNNLNFARVYHDSAL